MRDPISFEEIHIVDGIQYSSFRDTCHARGLICDEKEYIDAIVEVWYVVWTHLCDDAEYNQRRDLQNPNLLLPDSVKKMYGLVELEKLLSACSKSLGDYPFMPVPDMSSLNISQNRLLSDELSYDCAMLSKEHDDMVQKLTTEQRDVYDKVMTAASGTTGGLFFVYGYGVLWLTKNLRLHSVGTDDEMRELFAFANWIASIGDGQAGGPKDGHVEVPIPPKNLLQTNRGPIQAIVETPTLEVVDEVNNYMSNLNVAECRTYFSSDSVCPTKSTPDVVVGLHMPELLNVLKCSGLPNHCLTLKFGSPVMLLRNIDHSSGLCNGTRLIITKLVDHVVKAKLLFGTTASAKVLIPRLSITPSNTTLPFKFQRRQFPMMLSYVMTMSRSNDFYGRATS
ncbi:PREDICTED: uncharacterized protein LOC109183029 [Ipomoea nil]|uniref:uncharacterized protein LOC109183029 n=1 Tax=Ipomoea nil TaxID=35883 RepID=UPI0009013CBF|nr:PREDICTED: uncharacterized protein LOC109183029 [Ipomoea nil]